MAKTRFYIMVLCMVGLASAWGSAQAQATSGGASLPKKTLTIGTISDAPPYEFSGPDSQITGINRDVAARVLSMAGYDFTYQKMAFAGLLPALGSGRIDMVTVLYNTPERREQADFVDFMATRFAVLVPISATVKSWGDLCGKVVGGLLSNPLKMAIDTAAKECTDKGQGAITMRNYASITQELLDLENGRVEALIEDEGNFNYAASQKPDKYKVAFLTGKPNMFALAFKKGSPHVAPIAAAMQKFLASDEPAKLAAKYGFTAGMFVRP